MSVVCVMALQGTERVGLSVCTASPLRGGCSACVSHPSKRSLWELSAWAFVGVMGRSCVGSFTSEPCVALFKPPWQVQEERLLLLSSFL